MHLSPTAMPDERESPPSRQPRDLTARADATPLTECAEVVDALHLARSARNYNLPELRAAVEACARRYRAAGHPPERMIIDLKQRLGAAALGDVGEWFRSVVLDRTLVWAIEAYFEIP